MKEDIISEVSQSGGQMLLHREVISTASNKSSVIGYWEDISLGNVKTPSEVFSDLKEEGFDIEYKRIPLTREREAVASDVDAIHSCLLGYVLANHIIPCLYRRPVWYITSKAHFRNFTIVLTKSFFLSLL